ncbi:MAG: hypothetical protein FJ271_32200 [Planctomycetes bacterium]|nr:hypothetical protein [Planctomycetota bacterium]
MATTRSKNADEPESRSRFKWLLVTLATLAVAVTVVWWPGCKQYPEVTSAESLSLMKLLYNACNTRDLDKLSRVEQGIDRLASEGKMSAGEQDAFRAIIAIAKQGDWQRAQERSLRFARDQVR